MSALPTALEGQIYHELDGSPAVEATRFSISHAPPLGQKYGFAGLIGTFKGQAGTTIDLTFANTATKSQFNLLAMAAAKASGDLGFNYTFWDGGRGISRQWLIPNCFLGEYHQESDPQSGDGSKTVKIMGGPPVPVV